MKDIILGTGTALIYGYINNAYNNAFHEAHDDVYKKFGERIENIYTWCKENIPNEYEFYQTDCLEKELKQKYDVICNIHLKFLTDDAALAFRLRWM